MMWLWLGLAHVSIAKPRERLLRLQCGRRVGMKRESKIRYHT
jgi:hypothetical protein